MTSNNNGDGNLSYICLWKKLLNDKTSTSGRDMRKRGLPCEQCTGTKACGLEHHCSKYLAYKPIEK